MALLGKFFLVVATMGWLAWLAVMVLYVVDSFKRLDNYENAASMVVAEEVVDTGLYRESDYSQCVASQVGDCVEFQELSPPDQNKAEVLLLAVSSLLAYLFIVRSTYRLARWLLEPLVRTTELECIDSESSKRYDRAA